MKYFVDPYKKYYENLKDSSSMSGEQSSLSDGISSLQSGTGSLAGGISSSTWQELGATRVTSVIIPGLSALLNKLSEDISSTLKVAISKATEIVTKTTELKQKDEELENKQNELATLKNNEPKKENEDLPETAEHTEWANKIKTLEEDIQKLETKCKSLQTETDALANEINALEVSSGEDVQIEIGDIPGDTGELIAPDGTFVKSKKGYNVVNTQGMSVRDFENFIINNGLTQEVHQEYGNSCLSIAEAYGFWMMGQGTISGNMDSLMATPTSVKRRTSSNQQEILGYVYDELIQGKPCVLKVSVKDGVGRHFVTVVGMKDTVTSRDTLTANDLLILDVYDGQLETMDGGPESDRTMWNTDDGLYWMEALNLNPTTKIG